MAAAQTVHTLLQLRLCCFVSEIPSDAAVQASVEHVAMLIAPSMASTCNIKMMCASAFGPLDPCT